MEGREKAKKGVYFFHSPLTGRTKIGVTQNITRRQKEIMSACPDEQLYLLKFICCNKPYKLEAELHNQYAEYQIHNEWFNIPTADLIKIENEREYQVR